MGFTLNQLEQERQIRKLQKKEDKDTSNYEQLSNLPKINNVELKGDKTTSDLGINATNVMMSDGVTSVEDKVDELTDYVVDTTTINGVTITKMGHLVTLVINKTSKMNGSQWVSVGIVPYKPTTEIYGVAKQNAEDKIIGIDLMIDGNLAVMGSGSDTILVRGTLTYLTND